MANKTQEQAEHRRELTTQELEVVAGGMAFGIFALAAARVLAQSSGSPTCPDRYCGSQH